MLKTASGLLAATVAAIVLPAAAPAEELIPPGNSAVNQYTETIPTPRGHKDADADGKKRRQTPEQALGARNSQKLEQHGADGRATAALAAETAPTEAPPSDDGDDGNDEAGGGAGGNARGGDGDAGIGVGKPVGRAAATAPGSTTDIPEGSSGFGEVLGEATGSSSGELGLWLPLLIVAVAIWSVAYLVRHKRQVE